MLEVGLNRKHGTSEAPERRHGNAGMVMAPAARQENVKAITDLGGVPCSVNNLRWRKIAVRIETGLKSCTPPH